MSKKITVRLPADLDFELANRVVAQGYGMRGKSKWVMEAVNNFLDLQDYIELVAYGEDLEEANFNKPQAFYIDGDVVKKIQDALLAIRKVNPTLEGIKSLIIRSSIIQRIFRDY